MYSVFEHPSTTTIHTAQQSVGIQYDKKQQQYTMTQQYKQLLHNHILKIKSVHDSLDKKKTVKNSVHQSKINLENYGKYNKNNTVHESNNQNNQCKLKNNIKKDYQIKLPYLNNKNNLSNKDKSNKQNIKLNKQSKNINKQNTNNNNKKKRQSILQQTRQINSLYPSLHINIGSLHQYINHKSDKKIVFTSRKKRNQATLENSKFKKKKIASTNTQEQVLLSQITTHNQKKIASQVIVQKIFNEVYKNSLQQERDPMKKNSLVMKEQLQNLVKQSTRSLKKKGQIRRIKFADNNSDQKQQTNSSRLRNSILQPAKRHPLKLRSIKLTANQIITNLKNQYLRLRPIQIPLSYEDFLYLISVQNQIQKHLKFIEQQKKFMSISSALVLAAKKALEDNQTIMITQPIQIGKRMKQITDYFRKNKKGINVFTETIAKVTENQVVFKQMEFFNIQMGLYMIQYIKWEKIKVIRFQNIKIQTNILFLFLDTMSHFCPLLIPLEQLSICSIQITDMKKFIQKLLTILKKIRVINLKLNYLDLSSYDFNQISQGIVYNSHLQLLSLKNNQLNDMSIPSIQILLKNCNQLSRVQLNNNFFSDKDSLKVKDSRLVV